MKAKSNHLSKESQGAELEEEDDELELLEVATEEEDDVLDSVEVDDAEEIVEDETEDREELLGR